MSDPTREALAAEDEELALSLAVAIVAAGNPSRFKSVGDHARAIIRELRRQPLTWLHLPAALTPPPGLRPADLDLFDQRIEANAQQPSIAGYQALVTDLRAALEGAPDE